MTFLSFYANFENDIDMLLIEKEGEFHFYLHNSFTDDSMVMRVDIHDFARMLLHYQIIFNETK